MRWGGLTYRASGRTSRRIVVGSGRNQISNSLLFLKEAAEEKPQRLRRDNERGSGWRERGKKNRDRGGMR